MKLSEIFETIQGEGIYTGTITTFIRFAGCTLHCPECDTKYSWSDADKEDVGVPYIIEQVQKISPFVRHICITGGEPLEQPQAEMFNLLQTLFTYHGVAGLDSIVIEINGSRDITWLFNKPFRRITSLSVDFKLPSTGKSDKMLTDDFKFLEPRDLIKFVCAGEEDFCYALKVLDTLKKFEKCHPVILFHALGGGINNWLPKLILANRNYIQHFDIRTNVQLHKLFEVR